MPSLYVVFCASSSVKRLAFATHLLPYSYLYTSTSVIPLPFSLYQSPWGCHSLSHFDSWLLGDEETFSTIRMKTTSLITKRNLFKKLYLWTVAIQVTLNTVHGQQFGPDSEPSWCLFLNNIWHRDILKIWCTAFLIMNNEVESEKQIFTQAPGFSEYLVRYHAETPHFSFLIYVWLQYLGTERSSTVKLLSGNFLEYKKILCYDCYFILHGFATLKCFLNPEKELEAHLLFLLHCEILDLGITWIWPRPPSLQL